MAAYQTGTVRVTAGSSKVFGNGTEWNIYVGVGDLFQRTTENVFYDVAAVNSATQLTLTSRYANTNLVSAVATNVASVTVATKIYSGNVGSFTPVIQNTFVIVASPNGGGERFSDNGAGVLTGEASPAGSGTIDYDTGAWSITFGTALTATLNLQASFNRGNYTDGAGYQIVSDFTPNYKFPEMSTNDVNFAHIFTKAVRKIDQKILAASGTVAASVITGSHFHGQVSATFNNMSIINASVTNASIQNLTVLHSMTKLGITSASLTNASITNASIQNLNVLNAINQLQIVNASVTNASIQNLNVLNAINQFKAVNASVTNASIRKLVVNASRLKTNQTYDGYVINATVNATVAFGQLLYLDSVFNYDFANNATSSTVPAVAMAVSAGTGKQKLLLRGQVCNTAWSFSATKLVYVAATNGALTQLVPAGVGNFTQIIGYPISADTIFFNPNLVMTKGA